MIRVTDTRDGDKMGIDTEGIGNDRALDTIINALEAAGYIECEKCGDWFWKEAPSAPPQIDDPCANCRGPDPDDAYERERDRRDREDE